MRTEPNLKKYSIAAVCVILLTLAVGAGILIHSRQGNASQKGSTGTTVLRGTTATATKESAEHMQTTETQSAETQETTQREETTPNTASQGQSDAQMFPCVTGDGLLEIVTLFQFSGNNPDCAGAEAQDVAAIQLKNNSGTHLRQADIDLVMTDGTVLKFQVKDIPADAVAMAFSVENLSAGDGDCAEILCNAEYEEQTPLLQDMVEVTAEYIQVTVTNICGQDLQNLTVTCHGLLNGEIFGGIGYEYEIEHLPAGQSVTLDAWDCYLGGAQVVRLSLD